VCIIHHSVPWNRKRVRDFIEVMKHYDSVKVFIRYIIVGILGIVINLLLFFTFYQLMGIDDLIALWAAIEISILITFFLNNYWVYFNRKYTRSLPWRMGAYHLTMITGIVMNIGIYKVLAVLGVNYLLGDLIGILVSSVWNFYMTNAHVFFAAYLEENSKM
jgi:putative flippase GtrA